MSRKALKVFEILKRKADEKSGKSGFDPRLDEYDDELYFRELRRSAMKSLHLEDEVKRTEEGFEVV